MKRSIKSLLLLTCMLSSTSLGAQAAFAADGSTTSATQPTAQSQPGPRHAQRRHQRKGQFFKELARELNLTDAQKAQARELWKTSQTANRPLMTQLVTAKHQLRSLIASGTADEAAVQAQAATVAAAESKLAVQRAQNVKQFLALLTPDQTAKYHELQQKKEQRFQRFLDRHQPPAEMP